MTATPFNRDVLPRVIQGGMGVAVSNWKLARAVSLRGQLGVVSGTALDTVFVRRLQDGDPDRDMRRAIAAFPLRDVAANAIEKFFIDGGKPKDQPYRLLPMFRQYVSAERQQLTVLANFVEVFLAKENHGGVVGINFLTKVQMPTLPSLYGAMLAGVDYVLMGAGIPREIPGALDALSSQQAASLKFEIEGGSPSEPVHLTFDPSSLGFDTSVPLKRPAFLPIISAASLATTLARKANGSVEGFVVEGPTAGGHNAPPRGEPKFNERGEPLYSERDNVDLAKLRELGLPFWLAGGSGSPESLDQAIQLGAAGIQVGTLFAFCEESGFADQLKRETLDRAARNEVDVITDPRASPTGYPFKVVHWAGDETVFAERERKCDLGYLRNAFRRDDGKVDYRCAAEPVADYLRKGGKVEDTVGRRCLCNALTANIDQAQARPEGKFEPPLLTSGDDLTRIASFLQRRQSYDASDVIDYLLS